MPRYKVENGVRIQYTNAEETAADAELKSWNDGAYDRAIADLRAKRNMLLIDTDVYGLSDITMADNMKTYRQALRDLPAGLDTIDKVNNATFPTKP